MLPFRRIAFGGPHSTSTPQGSCMRSIASNSTHGRCPALPVTREGKSWTIAFSEIISSSNLRYQCWPDHLTTQQSYAFVMCQEPFLLYPAVFWQANRQFPDSIAYLHTQNFTSTGSRGYTLNQTTISPSSSSLQPSWRQMWTALWIILNTICSTYPPTLGNVNGR